MTSKQLNAALRHLGWTQLEAARRLHVNARTVRRWVAGDRRIPGPVVAALQCELKMKGDSNA